ncbi:bifunctional phosphopantothenoylcysteine decarboxylase/phosphopantothenate--cysteine ligase CoaBC [Halocola ammonii]
MFDKKKIIVAVTGSIAAYKSALLVRLLVKGGAEVKVVMTKTSHDFITPLTLSTLSKNPVFSDFTENEKTGEWTNHVDLGLWADALVVAPASANTLAKMANGVCDNFLLATYLSAKCPVFVAPAMDLDMYRHKSTSRNLETLIKSGDTVIDSEDGELASGLSGKGRMAEPEQIVSVLDSFFNELPLKGKTYMVSAGPTYERIDPVRFIGNHSSGKMGFAIAEELAAKGAEVKLVHGPTNLSASHSRIHSTAVTSAEEMFNACHEAFKNADGAVMAAAVSDYRPANQADKKIKKSEASMSIEMEPTKDILASLGEIKSEKQFLVGFALETNDEEENARKKLHKKNLDFIVLNSLRDKGAGFGHDTNKVSIISSDDKIVRFELLSKAEVATEIVNQIIERSTR